MNSRPLIDWDTHAHLDEGWIAVLAVNVDGSTWPWLLDLDDDQEDGSTCLRRCCVPHDQTGRLPKEVRARVWPCRAITRSGRPCATPARDGTDRCSAHARATPIQ